MKNTTETLSYTETRMLDALRGTIFTRYGTKRRDGGVDVFVSHSPHAFYLEHYDWAFERLVEEFKYIFGGRLTTLEELNDDPWITQDKIRWYKPVITHWSFSYDIVGSVTVTYNRKEQSYNIEVFYEGSTKSGSKSGWRFEVENVYTKEDVVKLLNAIVLWKELSDKERRIRIATEKDNALEKLP